MVLHARPGRGAQGLICSPGAAAEQTRGGRTPSHRWAAAAVSRLAAGPVLGPSAWPHVLLTKGQGQELGPPTTRLLLARRVWSVVTQLSSGACDPRICNTGTQTQKLPRGIHPAAFTFISK